MRDEDNNLECGVVYKQTLINSKLHIGKGGKRKAELNVRSPLRRQRFAWVCTAI